MTEITMEAGTSFKLTLSGQERKCEGCGALEKGVYCTTEKEKAKKWYCTGCLPKIVKGKSELWLEG